MKIVNSIKDLKAYLAEAKQDNKKIGFVPTMGAQCIMDILAWYNIA